jgi:hypothetical protein
MDLLAQTARRLGIWPSARASNTAIIGPDGEVLAAGYFCTELAKLSNLFAVLLSRSAPSKTAPDRSASSRLAPARLAPAKFAAPITRSAPGADCAVTLRSASR